MAVAFSTGSTCACTVKHRTRTKQLQIRMMDTFSFVSFFLLLILYLCMLCAYANN